MKCYIIAGPNGAGKTTFAKAFLPEEGECINFVNADLIAEGLSPFNPEGVAFEAGKLLLKKLDDLTEKRESFAFETTLSGLNYAHRIKVWKELGYEVILFFLKLPHEEMAVQRVKLRVSEGGHNVPEETIKRRFKKGLDNLQNVYHPARKTPALQAEDISAIAHRAINGVCPAVQCTVSAPR